MKTTALITRVFFLAFFLFISINSLYAQSGQVKGRLRDSKTLEPLPFGNVFINLTTLGVAADQVGNYSLSNIPTGTHEIVFSFVGYKSYQKKIQMEAGITIELDVLLVPDETELETVVVSSTRDKEWDKQLKRFEKIFLGTTRFANSCEILNPWILEFKETVLNGKNVFTATASRPLEIENSALGYRVDYHLRSMASTADGYNIQGEVRMEELKSADPKTTKTWGQNRATAYQGSLRHLLKSIVDGRVQEEGFDLYIDKSGYENNPYRSAVFATQLDKSLQTYSTQNTVTAGLSKEEYVIQVKQRIEVHYRLGKSQLKVYNDIPYPISWIEVIGGVLRTNSNGILLNPSSLIISGAMNEARVGDLLPYNYSLTPLEISTAQLSLSSQNVKLNRLIEKPYLHTDKSYYYPGEKIWFKAYMNYKSPDLMDSLSQVLYVELIGPDKTIMQSKTLSLFGGSTSGSFVLPQNIKPDSYFLRAYTHWMINYDAALIFTKPIPILGLYERAEVNKITDSTNTSAEIKMKSPTTFNIQDRVKLDFELKDVNGNPILGDLSISVTDLQQAIAIPDEINILESFPFSEEFYVVNSSGKPAYPIESGISLHGQYKNKTGKPEKTELMVVEGNFNKTIPMQTDAHGNFWVTGFQFNDSSTLSFQTAGKKKKFEGAISILPRYIPPVKQMPEWLTSFLVVKENSIQHSLQARDLTKESTLLKEIVVKEEKEEISKNVPNTYSKADFTFTGEEIVSLSRVSIVNALIGRVPGLGIVNGYLRIGGGSNFMGAASTEPLIIIDGVHMTIGGTSRLYQITPEMVERIDVIKYGGAAIYGSRGANGIIIVTTKTGEFTSVNPSNTNSSSFQQVVIQGYATSPAFVGYNYDLEKRYEISDSGSTIFWTPQVISDENTGAVSISFNSGPKPTRYRIVMEGVSAMGDPLRGVFVIEIK
jgi:TonB-dependent SusC/RagA subfamily outer membrane receptor